MNIRNKKKYLLILFFAIVTIFYIEKERKNDPNKISKKFLTNYYEFNFSEIYDISTEKTLEKIKDIESRLPEDFDKTQLQIPVVEIYEYYIENDTAYCRYSIKQNKEDSYAMSETLLLIKSKNKWLVDY